MRKLTITRTKSFVGCAASLKVYIADSSGVCDLTIEGLPCRFYGKIKNGKSGTFEIPDHAVRVYVIFDKMSADYCNDVYIVEAGEADVALSGKCRFDPTTGNAFRFDGNDHPDAVSNRNRGSKKGLIIFLVCLAVGIVVGTVIGLLI